MKQLNGAFKWIFDMGNWLFKFIYLHTLWVTFSILGLVVFGIFPATAGVFAVVRKWLEEGEDIPVFQTFFQAYKSVFLQANGLGYIMTALGLFFAYDFMISREHIGSILIHGFLIFILLLFVLVVCYIFPVYVRYDLRFFLYIKQSLLVALARPLESIGMLLSLLLLYYILILLPFLFVMAGSSIVAFLIMALAYHAFIKIEERKSDSI